MGNTLPGWTSTVVIVAAVGAVQLLALGILGEYVGRTYAAVQARPEYFVAHDSLEAEEGGQAGLARRAATGTRSLRPGPDRLPRRPTWSS